MARDLKYIDPKTCNDLNDKCDEAGRLINGLIKSIENQK
jgi:hypothetical protein